MPARLPLPEVISRLERVLAGSPAATTEISWIELDHGGAASHGRLNARPAETSVLVRVRESGRTGVQHTADTGVADLEHALRVALAQARLAPASPAHELAPAAESVNGGPDLHDPELAAGRGRELLGKVVREGDSAQLEWTSGRVVVVNSAGLRRTAEATAATVTACAGEGPGAGWAASSARRLDGHILEEVVERARSRHQPGEGGETAVECTAPVVLSPEAAAVLITAFNGAALSSLAFLSRSSPLVDQVGQQVLAPALSLTDDGTDPAGLPFPYDLFGRSKAAVELIRGGILVTPARDTALAAAWNSSPTPHQVAADEAIASHLFLASGTLTDEELRSSAAGGIWIDRFASFACVDAPGLPFRARAQGVRRLAGGSFGAPIADLICEGRLLTVLQQVVGLGRDRVVLASTESFFGATTAPALALAPASTLLRIA